MKRISFLMSAVAMGLLTAPAMAGSLDVSGTLSGKADGANFDYTITLSNSSASTDSLETFWFAWVPGKDFLMTHPLTETPPSGWTDMVTNGGTTDGFAIQFVTTTAPLAPGNSLTFLFTSTDTPAEIAGFSHFYPTIPVETSFVYQGAPFAGDSLQFVVQSVPEPSTLTLGIIGVLGSIGVWRARRALAHRPAAGSISTDR